MEDIKTPIRFVSTLAAAPKAFRFKPKIATPAAAAAAAIDEETVQILDAVAKREAEARAKREAEARAKREAEARAKLEAEARAKRAEASLAQPQPALSAEEVMQNYMIFQRQEGEKRRESEAAQKLQEQEAQRAKLVADAEWYKTQWAKERAKYTPAPQ